MAVRRLNRYVGGWGGDVLGCGALSFRAALSRPNIMAVHLAGRVVPPINVDRVAPSVAAARLPTGAVAAHRLKEGQTS